MGWSSLIRLTTFSPGMSAAVTRTTVDQSKSGSRSRPTKRARGSLERIVAPNQAPGTTRSSAYFARPVSLSGPSRRSGTAGRARPGAIVPGWTTRASGAGPGAIGAIGDGVRVTDPVDTSTPSSGGAGYRDAARVPGFGRVREWPRAVGGVAARPDHRLGTRDLRVVRAPGASALRSSPGPRRD